MSGVCGMLCDQFLTQRLAVLTKVFHGFPLPVIHDNTVTAYHIFLNLSFSRHPIQHYPMQWRRCH